MKYLPHTPYCLLLVVSLFAQDGFTDKNEARNKTVNGLKEGKWIEYTDSTGTKITLDKNAPGYILSIYKAGKREGMARGYQNTGNLSTEIPYINGERNGMAKCYYADGKLFVEEPFFHDKEEGMHKVYYDNGEIEQETPMLNGKAEGIARQYY